MSWEAKELVAGYAAVLSTLVFAWTVGKEVLDRRKTKLERTRVFVGMHAALYRVPGGKHQVVVVLDVSNLGRESCIVTGAVVVADGSTTHAGSHKEPDAAYGRAERVLPRKVEPGETVELQLFGPGIFQSKINRIYVTDADDKPYDVTAQTIERVRSQWERFEHEQGSAEA